MAANVVILIFQHGGGRRGEGNHLVGQGRQLSVIAAVTVPALAEHEIVEDIVDTTGGNRERRPQALYRPFQAIHTIYFQKRKILQEILAYLAI